MTDKIKILYLAANPTDTSHVRVAAEARELTSRMRQGLNRDAFEIIYHFAVRPQDLLRGLQEVEPHIMHFSGHATFDHEIVLETEDGTSQPIAPELLAELVEQFKTNLKVAVMSCCFGRAQAKALNQVLDFTIGMEKPLSDTAAVNFSANFYQVLASGGSIKQAFEGARLVTIMQGRQAFEKSDLLVRRGASLNDPFIKLLPTLSPIPEQPVVKTKPPDNSISQVISHSDVGIASVVTGENNTTNSTVHSK
jgi:CHAT domain